MYCVESRKDGPIRLRELINQQTDENLNQSLLINWRSCVRVAQKRWRLRRAVEPRFAMILDGGGAAAGLAWTDRNFGQWTF